MSDETQGPEAKGRTMKEVTSDIQSAGIEENEPPKPPEPKKLTPEELQQDPKDLLEPDEQDDLHID